MNETPEQVARARQMYLDGVTVAEICKVCRLSNDRLYYWLRGGPPEGEGHLPPLPLRLLASGGKSRRRRLNGDRAEIVGRIWRTAEAQVREIEERLARHARQPDDRARDVRTLAVLVKTMRELAAFDAIRDGAAPPANTEDDDAGPRDLDEFRRELARRMEAIIAARTEDVSGGTDA